MSTANPELQEIQDLLGRLPEQPEDAVTTGEVREFKELLKLHDAVPESKEPKTFFEICDVSSRELSYSSFLEFFLNPSGEHGCGNLFLKSLVEVSGETLNINSVGCSIEREVLTDKGGKIDLVIEGDSFVILIENKLWASVYNDLQDYSQYLEKRASEGDKKKLAILLSIKKEQTAHGFKPVLYGELAAEIQKNLGQTLPQADHRSITYLLDFITSIHHLEKVEKGTNMDKTLLEFFKQNEKSSLKLHQKTQELVNTMRDKVKKVAEKVQFPSPFKKKAFYASLKEGREDPAETSIYDAVYADVEIKGFTCWVEAVLHLNTGWVIEAVPHREERFADLGTWLKNSGVKAIEKSPPNWKRWVYAEFPFEESEEIVAGKYRELLSKIADKLKNKSTR